MARYQDALVPEDNIYVSVLSPTLAAALGVDAVPRAVRGAGLAAVLAVDEQVGTGVAACVPRLAVEGAAVHVRDAAVVGDGDCYLIAAHVDEAADVHGRPFARRELTPRVVDLAPLRQRRLVVVQRRETTRDVPRYRDRYRVTGRRQRVCDLGLALVHERSCSSGQEC